MQKYLVLLLISLLAALSGVATKFAVLEVSPGALILARFSLALLFMMPFYRLLRRKSLREIAGLLLFSSGMGLSTIFFAYGVKTTNIGATQSIFLLLPILALILSHYLLKEKIHLRKILGILISIAGASIIFFIPKLYTIDFNVGSLVGNSFIVLSVMSYASYIVFYKRSSFSRMEFMLGGIMGGTFAGSILGVQDFIEYGYLFKNLTLLGCGNILFISAIGTVAFYFLVQHLIKISSPFFASFSAYLALIFSTYFGFLFFDEYISIEFFIGTLLTIYGVYFINRKNHSF